MKLGIDLKFIVVSRKKSRLLPNFFQNQRKTTLVIEWSVYRYILAVSELKCNAAVSVHYDFVYKIYPYVLIVGFKNIGPVA